MLKVSMPGDDTEIETMMFGGDVPAIACQIGEVIRAVHTACAKEDPAKGEYFRESIKLIVNHPAAPTWDGAFEMDKYVHIQER